MAIVWAAEMGRLRQRWLVVVGPPYPGPHLLPGRKRHPTVAVMKPADGAESSFWPRTNATEIIRVGLDRAPDKLDEIIRRYAKPLRLYFISRFPSLRGEAEAWVHDFSQDKIFLGNLAGRFDPSRGRLRHLLKRSFQNYVLDRLKAADHPVELDSDVPEPVDESNEDCFDLEWVRQLIQEAIGAMRADCQSADRPQPAYGNLWILFESCLLRPLLEDAPRPAYDDLIRRLGLRSPLDASNMMLQGKRMFKRHLEACISRYAAGEESVRIELDDLLGLLAQFGRRPSRSPGGTLRTEGNGGNLP